MKIWLKKSLWTPRKQTVIGGILPLIINAFTGEWLGAHGGAVGGGTALQAGRSRVRFPMVSLEFFIDIILPAAYGPGVDSASNKNEYQEYLLGIKAAGV